MMRYKINKQTTIYPYLDKQNSSKIAQNFKLTRLSDCNNFGNNCPFVRNSVHWRN